MNRLDFMLNNRSNIDDITMIKNFDYFMIIYNILYYFNNFNCNAIIKSINLNSSIFSIYGSKDILIELSNYIDNNKFINIYNFYFILEYNYNIDNNIMDIRIERKNNYENSIIF